jgi:hypothetical protein
LSSTASCWPHEVEHGGALTNAGDGGASAVSGFMSRSLPSRPAMPAMRLEIERATLRSPSGAWSVLPRWR